MLSSTKYDKTKTNVQVAYISDSDIVPDEEQQELISLRDDERENFFRVGDIANLRVARSVALGLPVTAERVYAAVGRFRGRSSRTIRYYAECALFYRQEDREEYGILPFSFFVYAKTKGDQWKSVLDYAMLNPVCTLDELRLCFVGDNNPQPVQFPQQLQQDIEDIIEQNNDQQYVLPRYKASLLIASLSEVVEYLSRLLRYLPMSDGLRNKVEACVVQVKDTLPYVLDEAGSGE
jgi:hypothetical protein